MKKVIISGLLICTFIGVNAQNTKYDSNGSEIGKEATVSKQNSVPPSKNTSNENLDDNGIDKRAKIAEISSPLNNVNNTHVQYFDVDGNPSAVPTSHGTYQFVEIKSQQIENDAVQFRNSGNINTDVSKNVPETYRRNADQNVAPFDAKRESYHRASSTAQSVAIVKVSEQKVISSNSEAKDNASNKKPEPNSKVVAVQSAKAMNTNNGDQAAYATMPKSYSAPTKATSPKKAATGPSDSDQKK